MMGQKEEKKENEKEEKKEKEKEEKKEEEEEKKLVHTDGGDQPKEVHEVLVDLKMRMSNDIPLAKRGQAPQS